MTEYTPTTEEVRANWEASLWEGTADAPSREDAQWDGERMRAQFDRWLAEHTRQVAERAWDEGFVQAMDFMDDPALPTPLNPYRKETP